MPLPRPGRPDVPVRVLQFGEGHFLRAFVDWMLQRARDAGIFDGAVRVVRPLRPDGMAGRLAQQDYVYTVALRGRENGRDVDTATVVDVIRDGVDPYAEWPRFLGGARESALRFVVSNTTEAGIAYAPCAWPAAACPTSFPAKVAAFLAARHDAFAPDGGGGGPDGHGLVFLPCELVEHNGDRLRDAVLRHLDDWGKAGTVGAWVARACRFHNTLVDRIVTGFPPQVEAEALWARWGYRDDLLTVGEPFALWVIEGDDDLAREWPPARTESESGHVVVTDRLAPYRDRKVRVLNGAHTAGVAAAFLAGLDTVGELMADDDFAPFLRRTVAEEILPGVRLPDAEKNAYADAVFERFRNPFLRHGLLSIALNSVSKWRVRVEPSVRDYAAATGRAPKRLALSMAAWIAFYRGTWSDGRYMGMRDGQPYAIHDERPALDAFDRAWRAHPGDAASLARAALSDPALWGADWTGVPGWTDAVAGALDALLRRGPRAAIRDIDSA